MKKHVVLFNYALVDYPRNAFIYVMNVCMKKCIEFNAICRNFKGRLEFECDERDWDALVSGCLSLYKYMLIEDESL